MSTDSVAGSDGEKPRPQWVAILAMIGSAACWGFATVMSRDLLVVMPSTTLLVIQLVASVAALLALSIPHFPWRHRTAAMGKAASIGVLEPGLTYTIGLIGLSLTTAGSASVIGATEPVLIVLVAWVLLREKPSSHLMLCIAIAVFGLLLVSGDGFFDKERNNGWGDLLIILSTLFAASYVVLSSRVVHTFPAATLASAQQIVGLALALVVFLVVTVMGLEPASFGGLSLPIVAYAAFSGVIQYALAFWLYLLGLKNLSAGAAGLWLTLVPVFGLAGAYVWLSEVPTVLMIVGAALIICAVILGNKPR